MSDAESGFTYEAGSIASADPVAGGAALVETTEGRLTWVPFALYLGAWVVLAAGSVYLLQGAVADTPARWLPWYPTLLWAAVVLTATGPILSLIVWMVARSRRAVDARSGLFTPAMMRGALATVAGVAIWLGALYAIELVAMNGVLG